MTQPPFILASASPRRRGLLQSAGLAPEVLPQDVDETPLADEAPLAYVLRIATAKAQACDSSRPVLAADTVVALDSRCLGKATTDEFAFEMLSRLSGRSHAVHTAVVLRANDQVFQEVVTTEVVFRTLTDDDVRRYIATGECADKAGGYGIQSEGGALVARIAGSYTNVVGLPLQETLRMLKLAGVC